jgi:hypothetical protein
MITLGEKFGGILGQLKAQVAAQAEARDLDAFLAPAGDPVAAAERAVLDAATEWAVDTGTEAQVKLLEAVMVLHAARGGR